MKTGVFWGQLNTPKTVIFILLTTRTCTGHEVFSVTVSLFKLGYSIIGRCHANTGRRRISRAMAHFHMHHVRRRHSKQQVITRVQTYDFLFVCRVAWRENTYDRTQRNVFSKTSLGPAQPGSSVDFDFGLTCQFRDTKTKFSSYSVIFLSTSKRTVGHQIAVQSGNCLL